MTAAPAPEPAELDPRISAAAARLTSTLEDLPPGAHLDPTPILTDARWRALIAALIDTGTLDDDTAVRLEVAAIDETVGHVRRVVDECGRLERIARLRADLAEVGPLLAPMLGGVSHPHPEPHGQGRSKA